MVSGILSVEPKRQENKGLEVITYTNLSAKIHLFTRLHTIIQTNAVPSLPSTLILPTSLPSYL